MIQAGDELGRTQKGNNNAYCQDNELNWIDWSNLDEHSDNLSGFLSRLLDIRRSHEALSSPNYIHPPHTSDSVGIEWLNGDGQPMREEHWQEHHNYVLGYRVSSPDQEASRTSTLVIFNNSHKPQQFKVPGKDLTWEWLLDTTDEQGMPTERQVDSRQKIQLNERSVSILRTVEQLG